VGQRHLKEIKKFVVLRHLDGPNKGACFWTTAEQGGGDNTRGSPTRWYEEVLFTNSEQEAIDTCARRGRPLHAETL
jgi:hypothetical protein